MPMAAPALMSGSSMTARPTSVAPWAWASSSASSVARSVLVESSRPMRMLFTMIDEAPGARSQHSSRTTSEEHVGHDAEDGHEDRERPERVPEERGHADAVLLGDGLDHEVR